MQLAQYYFARIFSGASAPLEVLPNALNADARGWAAAAAGQNTLEWFAGDVVWNEVLFDGKLFSVWFKRRFRARVLDSSARLGVVAAGRMRSLGRL